MDQTTNKTDTIHYTCTLYTIIKGITQKHLFYVIGCRRENIILRLPWLYVTNPTIDWAKQTLTIPESCDQLKDLYSTHTADTQWYDFFFQKPFSQTYQHLNLDTVYDSCLYNYLDHDMDDQYLQHLLNNHLINRILQGDCKWFLLNSLVIVKLTMATELAITMEKVKLKVTLLLEYTNFTQVFFKEATNHVFLSCPYKHKINLDESFMPKIGKIYLLSPNEKKVTKDFFKENLAVGKMYLSNSSQESPFFFVKKKDSKLHPCQDYGYLNKHTTHDAYPLLIISNLIDKLKDTHHFTKFDIHWDYDNGYIKDGHCWNDSYFLSYLILSS